MIPTPLLTFINRLSLRARLCLLILLLSVPAIALATYSLSARHVVIEANQRKEILNLSKLAAANQSYFVQGAQAILKGIAREAIIRKSDWAGCPEILRHDLSTHPLFKSLYVALPNGDVVCSATPIMGKAILADSPSFQKALLTKDFVVGQYQVSRTPVLPLHSPVFDDSGKLIAVVSASLDLRALNASLGKMGLPQDEILLLLDQAGTVLARNIEGGQWLGQSQLEALLTKAVLERGEGVIKAAGIDGISRLWGFSRVGIASQQPIYAVIGLPVETMSAELDRAFQRNLMGLALAICLLLLGVWFGTKYLLLDKVSAIVSAANRVRGGDFSARIGLARNGDGLCQVAQAFDIMAERLEAREAELYRALSRSHQKAIHDSLTGLNNRGYMEEALGQLTARAQRNPQPLAIIMADIDFFKRVNDTFGHAAGDQVLRAIAKMLKDSVREGDIACRYGGEEFMLVLPGATEETARQKANELLEGVRRIALDYKGRSLGRITLSIGIATNYTGSDRRSISRATAEHLIQAADEALYQAKEGGRNRVVESHGWQKKHT
jgi:diguanylate cyclase (GGDEF)-like protein